MGHLCRLHHSVEEISCCLKVHRGSRTSGCAMEGSRRRSGRVSVACRKCPFRRRFIGSTPTAVGLHDERSVFTSLDYTKRMPPNAHTSHGDMRRCDHAARQMESGVGSGFADGLAKREIVVPRKVGDADPHHLKKIIFTEIARSAMPNMRCRVALDRLVATVAPSNPPSTKPAQMKAAIFRSTKPCL
jgi:hypothetical protein